jgi:GDPmannose 4,6-dehydratase
VVSVAAARPDNYVRATGQMTPVRNFVEKSFRMVDIEIDWREGVEERGIDASNGKTLIEADPRCFRPTEVDLLLGDPGRI